MPVDIRRIQLGDEAILAELARDEQDFDVEGRGQSSEAPELESSRAFLGDPGVLFWVAEDEGRLVGFLWCQLVRRRAASPELLLYEIGVHARHRRRGVGRRLITTMDAWMEQNAVREVWVVADNDVAVDFYRACGFTVDNGPAIYMTREGEH